MKNTKSNFLKHKFQWLVLLVALFGVSQGAWSTDYTAGTSVYVRAKTQHTMVKLYAWKNSTSASDSYPGSPMAYVGKNGDYYYWKITFSKVFDSMIVLDGSSNKISGSTDGSVSSFGTGKKCITINNTNNGYSWDNPTIDDCSLLPQTPNDVLNGTKIMYYITSYDNGSNQISITNGDKNCITENTTYINMSKDTRYVLQNPSNVPGTLNVTNNCGNWAGAGSFNTSTYPAVGARYIANGTNTHKQKTSLNTFTVSNSSIPVGTASVRLTFTASLNHSSLSDYTPLWALIYIKDGNNTRTKYGCSQVTGNSQYVDINTSTLEIGEYTIEVLFTDGYIFYKDGTTKSLTVTANCTPAPAGSKTITIKETSSGSFDDAVTVCSGTNVTVRVASAQSGYIYRVHSSSTPTADNKLAEGSCTSAGDFDISFNASSSSTCYVFALKSNSCESTYVGNNTVSLTVNPTPTITPSSTTAKNFEAVTLSSSASLNSSVGDNGWAITNISGSDSYLYNTTTTAAKFKGTVGGSSSKGFIIQGTASNGCVGSTTITVSADAEEICN